MNKTKIKNILYIKNFDKGKNLDYLATQPNIEIKFIESKELIGYSLNQLKNIIEPFDIIILGGGPQHLTTNNFFITHPEIINQIEIVKLVSNEYTKTKILLGICLGCQIIAISFGLKIVPAKKLVIGFDYLDITSINKDYINKSNDKYLSKLDFNLLSKSFSFHYDCIDFDGFNFDSTNFDGTNFDGTNFDGTNFDYDKLENISIEEDKLVLIGVSFEKYPHIITNTNSNIYGFQFHPEICINTLYHTLNTLYHAINTLEYIMIDENIDTEKLFSINILKTIELEKIYKHFFEVFFL